MIVQLESDGMFSLPTSLYSDTAGMCFIDGMDMPFMYHYRSAAVVGGTGKNSGMGVIAYDKSISRYVVHTPPAGSAWPSPASVQAVCGITGGLVAFATVDQGIPFIQVNKCPITDGYDTWDTIATVVFDKNYGTVQAMQEQGGTLYGFIKGAGSDNYFFSAPTQKDAPPTVHSYSGLAAEAFYPPQRVAGEPQARAMARRTAICNDKLYALDESHAGVLCATLDGMNVTTFPLASDTWGLIMTGRREKAYGVYTAGQGEIMPYTVSDSGLKPGPKPLESGAAVCPSLDWSLGLLYLIGEPSGTNTILDITTDTPVTLTGSDLLPPQAAMLQSSTWADSHAQILYISGVRNRVDSTPGLVVAYRVSVLPP